MSRLKVVPDAICYEGKNYAFMGFGIVGLICYGVYIPGLMLYHMYKEEQLLSLDPKLIPQKPELRKFAKLIWESYEGVLCLGYKSNTKFVLATGEQIDESKLEA